MLSGLKFIPRDQLDKAGVDDGDNDNRKARKNSGRRKARDKRKKYESKYSSSEEDLEKIKEGSRRKKKWYSSDEDLSSRSDDSGSESSSSYDDKKHKQGKRKKIRESRNKDKKGGSEDEISEGRLPGDHEESLTNDVTRKELGLDWMLRPKDNIEKAPEIFSDYQPQEAPIDETQKVEKVNPRELNPYFKNNGSGYPEDSEGRKVGDNQIFSSTVVGDGGASWRLKALKRAQEQAAREGRKVGEVVEERWGSLGQLAVSVASRTAAPTNAHLRAIKHRRKGIIEEEQATFDEKDERYMKDASMRSSKMKVPKLQDSLSWGKRKTQGMRNEATSVVSAAMAELNKFSDDGSFMRQFKRQSESDYAEASVEKLDARAEPKLIPSESERNSITKPVLSSNQLAAKALQLRMKGKHEEAEKLLKEAENMKVKPDAVQESSRSQIDGSTSRLVLHEISTRRKNKEEDADMYLAKKITRNHQFTVSRQADDEYDYDEGPRRKNRKKGGKNDHITTDTVNVTNRILTQQERCVFCFENPRRPKHLVVAIANFTYLSLPLCEPVVSGHCCILTMQHESATRGVDNNVWDEIRNFKKCLIMMFAKQEKDVLFLETVMGLAKQRRHCLVECIPVPREVAKQAPLYFKKAIDEAENEWSQHNAKKLIDTSEKGLRGSIPKDFPYFHVEFGLDRGFVHVIDDENEFKSSFGLNVVRGMLRTPIEDMHRRRKGESVDKQREAVADFARDWAPFDWTKQLD